SGNFNSILLSIRAYSKRQPQRIMSGCLDFSSAAFPARESIIATTSAACLCCTAITLLFFNLYGWSAEAGAGLEAQFKQLNDTVWSKENTAQKFEETFYRYWDDLRAAPVKLDAAKTMHFDELELCSPAAAKTLDHGISI